MNEKYSDKFGGHKNLPYLCHMEIVNTIIQQIGHKAFYMLGAHKPTDKYFDSKNPTWLGFKIKGCPKINRIKIALNSNDTYTMEFARQSIQKGLPVYKIHKTIDGVYFDMLHSLIEQNTGLYTNL